jgi:hypothetical protein
MKIWQIITLSFLALIIIIGAAMYGIPNYTVWQQGLAGEAKLKRAGQEKLIMIEKAKAEVEAAKYRSKAIALIGEMAKKYPEYRQQEFIGAFAEAMEEGNIDQIIYVATEAGIPILESNRLNR